MRLLLDTHVFLWHIADDGRLPGEWRAAIKLPSNDVYLSIASTWEASIKYSQDKLPLPSEPAAYFPIQRKKHRIARLAIRDADCSALVRLPSIHRDPFDRMLISQAIQNGLTLMTDDEVIKQYPVDIFR